jgi:hypothetical protein
MTPAGPANVTPNGRPAATAEAYRNRARSLAANSALERPRAGPTTRTPEITDDGPMTATTSWAAN